MGSDFMVLLRGSRGHGLNERSLNYKRGAVAMGKRRTLNGCGAEVAMDKPEASCLLPRGGQDPSLR
jgi:hypothetical protein